MVCVIQSLASLLYHSPVMISISTRLQRLYHIFNLYDVTSLRHNVTFSKMDDVDGGDLTNFDISIEKFVKSMRNKNTVRKTHSDINRFKFFTNKQWRTACVGRIVKDCFGQLFGYIFFMSIRKKDGEKYEPDSLKQFQCSINRYLSENKSEILLSI